MILLLIIKYETFKGSIFSSSLSFLSQRNALRMRTFIHSENQQNLNDLKNEKTYFQEKIHKKKSKLAILIFQQPNLQILCFRSCVI